MKYLFNFILIIPFCPKISRLLLRFMIFSLSTIYAEIILSSCSEPLAVFPKILMFLNLLYRFGAIYGCVDQFGFETLLRNPLENLRLARRNSSISGRNLPGIGTQKIGIC
jgi:hypothetical protein